MKAYILLDKSGSMASNWQETLGAVNGYVDALSAEKLTKKTRVTLATFDSMGALCFDVLRTAVKAKDWLHVTEAEATPRGRTPLYDAIQRLNTLILDDSSSDEATTVIFITDGGENGSIEATKEVAKVILDRYKTQGFDVVFIGADFDNFGQSASLGGAVGNTMVMSSGSYGAAMSGVAAKTAFFSKTGATRGFTDAERNSARGKTL